MTLRFHLKIDRKTGIAFLASAALLFALTNPFQKEKSAWDFYERMVKAYEMIQGVELSELEGKLKAVVKARNDCYWGLYKIPSRLTTCRKRYLIDILELARQNIKSSPNLGKFMLCIRECPLTYAICRGVEPDAANNDSECTVREVQCIEACLDLHWRGTGTEPYEQ